MKTPMQEVYENFNLMSDDDFKAWMLNTDLLKKEKQVIMKAYTQGRMDADNVVLVKELKYTGKDYYNENYIT